MILDVEPLLVKLSPRLMESGQYSEGPGDFADGLLSALQARMALPKEIDRHGEPDAAKIFRGQYSCGPGVLSLLSLSGTESNRNGPEPKVMSRLPFDIDDADNLGL